VRATFYILLKIPTRFADSAPASTTMVALIEEEVELLVAELAGCFIHGVGVHLLFRGHGHSRKKLFIDVKQKIRTFFF
jgi:hypothetical protein